MFKKILTAPTEGLGRWSRFVMFQLRLWRQCIKLLKQNHSGRQAAALSYHTIFGIVPLAIVMLMVFQMFPAYRNVGDKAREFLYEQARLSKIEYTIESADGQTEETIKLTEQIDLITKKFIANLNTGAITFFSGAIVVWAAIGLLITIERSFNNIWHAPRGRNFVQRIINYWALLTLGPLLLGLGLYVSTRYLAAKGLESEVFTYFRFVLPYLISVVALFFLYYVMPNTKVNAKAAIWGAAVAAIIWTGAKYAFGVYITKFIPLKAVYGVMGLVPLGVMWIYITWLIVLFGLQLSYATQHLKTLDAAEIAKMRKSDDYFVADDFAVMKIMSYILNVFETRHAEPVGVESICVKLNIPDDFAEKILQHLVTAGLLVRTTEPKVGYVPETEGGNITLAEIADAVSKASFLHDDENTPARLKALMAERHENLAGCTLKELAE